MSHIDSINYGGLLWGLRSWLVRKLIGDVSVIGNVAVAGSVVTKSNQFICFDSDFNGMGADHCVIMDSHGEQALDRALANAKTSWRYIDPTPSPVELKS